MSDVFKLSTRLGVFNAQWLSEHNLRVWTQADAYHYEGSTRVEDPGQPIRVNGVRLDVEAFLHRSGCIGRVGGLERVPSWCRAHDAEGWVPHGSWAFGLVLRAKDYDGGRLGGEIGGNTLWPAITRAGSGRRPSSSARRVVEAVILAAVANLARTTGDAPAENAEAEVRRRDLERLQARRDALQAELDQVTAEARNVAEKLAQIQPKGWLAVSA